MELPTHDLPGTPAGDPEVPGPGQPPPPARASRTGDPFDLPDLAPVHTRVPRRWLIGAAAAPWLVVAALLVVGHDPAPPPASAGPTPTAEATARPSPSTTPSAPATSPGSAGVTEDGPLVARGGTTGPGRREEAVGVAVTAARSWLSTRPGGVDVEGLEPADGAASRYVEHLVVESLDQPASGAVVVTLLASVLPVDGDTYGAATQVRLAVPVSLGDDRARLAGRPWTLPVTPVVLTELDTTPVEDPDLQVAATDALLAAGYRDVSLSELGRTSGWPWVADVVARAPGAQDTAPHRVWLRPDVGRLVVAGTAAPAGSDPTPAPSATEATP